MFLSFFRPRSPVVQIGQRCYIVLLVRSTTFKFARSYFPLLFLIEDFKEPRTTLQEFRDGGANSGKRYCIYKLNTREFAARQLQ